MSKYQTPLEIILIDIWSLGDNRQRDFTGIGNFIMDEVPAQTTNDPPFRMQRVPSPRDRERERERDRDVDLSRDQNADISNVLHNLDSNKKKTTTFFLDAERDKKSTVNLAYGVKKKPQ